MADDKQELPENSVADATKYQQAKDAERYGDSIPPKSMHYEEQVDLGTWEPTSRPAEIIPMESELEKELGHLLNRHSAENESGTPDFILAMFLKAQLDLFNLTVKNRAAWRGESLDLPARLELQDGQEVPLVMYTNNQRNEIGIAKVKVTPGEVLVTGTITAAIPQFADPGAAYSVDLEETNMLGDPPLNEPKDTPRPTNRFERYQQEGLSDNDG